jgi:succinoglycan biosynthesis transport protein ExoP
MSLDSSHNEPFEDVPNFRQYFNLFWHWAWLILLTGLIAGMAAFFFSRRMTPYYDSTTTVMVNVSPATQTTDYASMLVSQQLTSTYSEMMVKEPVLSQVISQLNIDMTPEELKALITVSPVRDTQLIQITAETTDPQLSANIANAVATVFSNQIQEIQSQRFAQSKTRLEAQLTDLENQINSYRAQASEAVTAEDKDRIDAKVTQYQQLYSNLLLSYEAVRLSESQSISSVVQVETAKPIVNPVRPKVMQNTLLATMVGFFFAAGAIIAREAMDDTIKTPEDISRKFKIPVLGVINHYNGKGETPITLADPRSPTAEAYRTLRTNVNYTSVDTPLRTLMITSSEPGEGKTTTVSNLAIVLAQNGKQVIVADCDLRHPRIHTYFRLNNRRGMSNLFAQSTFALDGSRQASGVDNLSVITTGSLPPNPAELLGSKKMQSILTAMTESAEVVLVDTPPILAVTDAAVLGPTVDGVILVVKPGKTRASALRQTLEQLHQVKANVLGVVLNDVVTRGSSYGYRYKYYRNYSAYQHYYGQKHEGGKKKVTGKDGGLKKSGE